MIFNWTATDDESDNEFEFGGTCEAEPDYGDYRPVFKVARAEAVARHGENVTVVEIGWVS